MYKTLLFILLPLASFGQIDTVFNNHLFIKPILLPGKPLRESGQFLSIGFAFAAVGVSSIIISDAAKQPMIEIFGDVLTISSLPFVCIGINKLFEAGRRQELIESYSLYLKP